MKVKLANYPFDAIEEIYKAYRLCYSKGTQDEIEIPYAEELRNARRAGDAKAIHDYHHAQRQAMISFIKPLMAAGHTSPLEHVSFTFYINDVSRSLTHQLVRHRTGKYNQQSQRYVKLDQFEYVVPPAIENNPYAKGRFIQAMNRAQQDYNYIVSELMNDYIYTHLVEELKLFSADIQHDLEYMHKVMKTRDKKKYNEIQKKAIEDARYVFPNACTSNITMTIDAHNFRNFIAQRTCVNAQWEIRDLANEMLKQAEEILPFIGYKAKWCGTKCKQCGGK